MAGYSSNRERAEHRRRIRKAVDYLQTYMETYTAQSHYEDYSESIVIDDVLYGLGVALWGDEHTYASGFDRTIAKLREHLERKP